MPTARARPVWSNGPRASIFALTASSRTWRVDEAGRDAGRPVRDRGHGRTDRVEIRSHGSDLRADAAHLRAEAGEGLEAQDADVHAGGQIVGGGPDVAGHPAQLRGQAAELVDAGPRGFDRRDDARERVRGGPHGRSQLHPLGFHAAQGVIEAERAPQSRAGDQDGQDRAHDAVGDERRPDLSTRRAATRAAVCARRTATGSPRALRQSPDRLGQGRSAVRRGRCAVRRWRHGFHEPRIGHRSDGRPPARPTMPRRCTSAPRSPS